MPLKMLVCWSVTDTVWDLCGPLVMENEAICDGGWRVVIKATGKQTRQDDCEGPKISSRVVSRSECQTQAQPALDVKSKC